MQRAKRAAVSCALARPCAMVSGLSERGLQIVLYVDHGAGDTHAAVPEFGDCARTMDASGFMSTQTHHFSVSSVSEPVSRRP